MIPPFRTDGLLPHGPGDAGHTATTAEVEARFVENLGRPAWRVALFEGWRTISAAVWEDIPTARWWVWGCFVSNHPTPLFGDLETLTSVAILPFPEVIALSETRWAKLHSFLQSAEANHRVDVGIVFEFPPGDERNIVTMAALEGKYRPRASHGVADHSTRDLVPAGFVEVTS